VTRENFDKLLKLLHEETGMATAMVKPVVPMPTTEVPKSLLRPPVGATGYYLDRNLEGITHERWRTLKANGQGIVRQYENESMHVVAEWVGGPFKAQLDPMFAKPFRLQVLVNMGDGKWVPDSSEEQWAVDEPGVITLYEDFLVRNTHGKCEFIGNPPRFIERGNKRAPPDPFAPTLDSGADEAPAEMGSW
jgi:hypothetical protein